MTQTFQPGDYFRSLQIGHLLGEGAHGEVYAAESLATREPFALKIQRLANRGDAGMVARALATARGACSIRHPNVAKVHDLGCEDDGTVYVLSELLYGCTIEKVLRWGRSSVVFALSVAIEAAKGLAAAHGAMVIHRDVKPSNLFLVNEGRLRTWIKVIDFSLAKVEGVETTGGRRAGLCTPGYAAPELLIGAPPHPSMDIYALGMVLWELLAGRHPFHAELHDLPSLIHRHRHTMPPLLSEIEDLPPRVDDVVRRAIAKDPAARFTTMMEMAEALTELRAWLIREERAGRVYLVVPAGEQASPGGVSPYEVDVGSALPPPRPQGCDGQTAGPDAVDINTLNPRDRIPFAVSLLDMIPKEGRTR